MKVLKNLFVKNFWCGQFGFNFIRCSSLFVFFFFFFSP